MTKISEEFNIGSFSNIEKIDFNKEDLIIYLSDGRVINSPISRFKNLNNASKDQLDDYQISREGNKEFIIWPNIDQNISSNELGIFDE